jgi:cation diffusion facilitator CzcD-associated flavoprotein CzcO
MTIRTPILIVGTGFAGICAGYKLTKSGRDDFIIIDRAGDIGGVWRDNTYPGIECDVPSHFYSFSFRPNPNWTKVFPPGAEILAYLKECANEVDLYSKIHFNTDMEDARWDDKRGVWVVKTSKETYETPLLIAAAGHLADPTFPEVDGLESFPGHKFHSAAWDHSVDLKGKRIGVVGTGASAIQIVPEMQQIASHLVVFQRSAAYMNMRPDRVFTDAEKRLFQRDPESIREIRAHIFWFGENQFSQRRLVPQYYDAAKQVALDHMKSQVSDPELREKLTPKYELGCKRRLSSSRFYPAVSADNVTLEPSALTRVDGSMVYGESGEGYELDALVFATGFEAKRPPFAERIYNAKGVSLDAHWQDGMQAYDCIAVHGYPNLFVVYGPNTGLGHNSAVYIIESQIDYIMDALDYFEENGITYFDAKADAEEEYARALHETAQGTVWLEGGCRSWYVDERSGRLTVVWPDFAYSFREENATFHPDGYVLKQNESVTS